MYLNPYHLYRKVSPVVLSCTPSRWHSATVPKVGPLPCLPGPRVTGTPLNPSAPPFHLHTTDLSYGICCRPLTTYTYPTSPPTPTLPYLLTTLPTLHLPAPCSLDVAGWKPSLLSRLRNVMVMDLEILEKLDQSWSSHCRYDVRHVRHVRHISPCLRVCLCEAL